jgi:hypothetical protein
MFDVGLLDDFNWTDKRSSYMDRSDRLEDGYLNINSGQTSIYDQAYIPLNVDTPVDITYKTSFPTNVPIAWQALVISGFENYLSFEMIMKVTIIQAYQSYVKINVYVGA